MDITPAQIWIAVAALMLIFELLTVTFFSAFLGVGALITALTTWLGLTPSLNSQLLCFSVVSVGMMVFLRKPLRDFVKKRGHTAEYSEYVGDKATVIETIPAGGEGKVFYRGTEWIALAELNTPIHKNKSVIIKRLEGIKLIVQEI
ncbi:MAG: NfeD family protein [Runella sp.]